VYGGGHVGLMGSIADAVLQAGREVTGGAEHARAQSAHSRTGRGV
jgi:predicted Rossmann-fold nucleotide-binding protein